LRQVWGKNDCIYDGEHWYRPGYSCESHLSVPGHRGLFGRAVCIEAIVINFSKAFDLIPHERLLMKLTASGVDSRFFVCVREFVVGRTR
jgi:hypothetical protein